MRETTPEIDAALVRRLLRRQFPQFAGLAIDAVPIQGWDNRSFRLGEELLVRLPSARAYAAQVEREQEWLPRLALHLPVPIPEPLHLGLPDEGYPWRWSIYRWIEGSPATTANIVSPELFAVDLAAFLLALQKVEPQDGPPPGGADNRFRGGSLTVYAAQAYEAVSRLGDRAQAQRALEIWQSAVASGEIGEAVWVHGDFAASNLLVRNGRLAAVIDFGCMAVGDPACDLTIAWTFLQANSRRAFRSALKPTQRTWARAKGWALWKALILVTGVAEGPAIEMMAARRVQNDLLSDED